MSKRLMIAVLISLITILSLITLLLTNNLTWLDTSFYNFIKNFINPVDTSIMKFITSIGNIVFLFPISLLVLILIWRNKKYALYGPMMLFVLGSSDLLNYILKHIFLRPRPDILRLVTENGYSFPSAHAMVSICFYGFIIYMIHKFIKHRWKYIGEIILGLMILLVGISRIYLGVHYLSDVIAGFAFGFLWLVICIYILNKLIKKTNKK